MRLLEHMQNAVRGAIYAGEDGEFVGVDLSQIEARGTAWMGGEEWKLKMYAAGEDIYCNLATKLFGRAITKKDEFERQAGKTVELSSGFGGGIGALERGCKKFSVDIADLASRVKPTPFEIDHSSGGMDWYYEQQGGTLPEDQAMALEAIKQRWRAENFKTVRTWKEIYDGFCAGVYKSDKLEIFKTSQGTRVITLPCRERQLFYRDCRITGSTISYDSRFQRATLTKGKLFENIVQACDRDITAWYMVRAHKEIAKIIHHSHDAYLIRVAEKDLAETLRRMEKLHKTKPLWTEGLPIDFEMWHGKRYVK